jgi:hypothetical protein
MTKTNSRRSLQRLTTATYTKLLRELRDMVYSHVYNETMDPREFLRTVWTAERPLRRHTKDPVDDFPREIDPAIVNPGFAKELVEFFLANLEDAVVVLDAHKIGTALNEDVFDVGARLGDQRLPGIAVCIHLGGDCENLDLYHAASKLIADHHIRGSYYGPPQDYAECFAPLLHEDQKLKPGFELKIVLHTNWGCWQNGDNILRGQTCWDAIAKATKLAVKALEPIVAALERKCGAKLAIGLSVAYLDELRLSGSHTNMSEKEWSCLVEDMFHEYQRGGEEKN